MLPQELASHISGILDLSVPDIALNGLQVERTGPIKKLLTAVDFSQELLDQAVAKKADALLVHHGLYWGKPFPIADRYYRLVRGLIQHNIALYAFHLPLDIHPEIGNNALLLRVLGLEFKRCFGDYKGVAVICCGEMKKTSWENFLKGFQEKIGEPLAVLGPDSPGSVSRVGVCSGGGLFGVEEAKSQGCDVYITGDAGHTTYHLAKELEIPVICGGHYNTEVWGVRALGERLAEEVGLSVSFVDIPTHL